VWRLIHFGRKILRGIRRGTQLRLDGYCGGKKGIMVSPEKRKQKGRERSGLALFQGIDWGSGSHSILRVRRAGKFEGEKTFGKRTGGHCQRGRKKERGSGWPDRQFVSLRGSSPQEGERVGE